MAKLIRMLPFLILLPMIARSAPPCPALPPENVYLTALLEKARRDELHNDPYWHTLLHYKRGVFGLRSLVDDPRFFAASNGKHNPAAELEGTIRSFFSPPREEERHPVCRFVARHAWLKEKLSIDETELPVRGCDSFDAILNEIQPESVTLIFPASHMNSPASMYGHTLLTIETAYESKLLSYAINYAAITDETFGPFYIVKGLLGLYEGYFSILPYYAKLQEYSDVNDRDIWEYPLNLNREEIERLMMHIYELEDIYSDYLFFSENCSYDLLFLLDAARPNLHLTDKCGWWVIPLDTIREIKKIGLIENLVFRPSKSTKIKHLAALLPESGRKDARAIAAGDLEPGRFLQRDAPSGEKVLVCDLASEYLQYRYAKKELDKKIYQSRFINTLEARSALGEAEEDRYRIPIPRRPDEGHHSNRISFGYGVNEDRPFQEIRLRPAYHTLLDNGDGYKTGSHIVFSDIVLNYHSLDRELELENIDLIDIISIAPRDRFFKHTSWKIKTGFLRRTMKSGGDYLVYGLNPGFGYAYEIQLLGLWYFMFESELQVGGALDGNYSIGGGGSAGLIRNITRFWKAHLFARNIYYGLGDVDNRWEAGIGQNLAIGADISFSAEVMLRGERDDSMLVPTARWNLFF